MQPSTVVILGSTGSIGTQGLDVISRHLDRFTVTGLAAGGAHVELLAQQAAKFHVPTVAIFYKEAVPALREALEQVGAGNVNITAGPDAVIAMAGSGADVVLNGITGSIGLEPSIAALQAGSQLALANKESVVAGGHLLFSAQVRDKQINPVDSEHSAIWQSLRSGTHGEVSKLVVTASGGPFRGWKRDQMTDITPEQAEASNDFSIAIRPAMVGPLCFSQIFYCGSTNPETQATYFRDQFYEIYNNGDETYYLDHLCFARLVPEFATATLPEWPAEDGLNNYVYAVTVWQLPGNGTDYPLKPGESFIITQEAANHADHSKYGGLIDTSLSEFETWAGNPQRVNPDVPDLEYVFWSGYIVTMQWLNTVSGPGLCIYQPGKHLEFPTINTGVVGETTQRQVGKTQEYVRIPAEQLIDGVEMLPTSNSLNMKRIPGFVDAGAASTEEIYVGKSVCRKVIGQRPDGTPIYQDTNNSTEDFETQVPQFRRNGEKMPAWNWSLK